MCGSFLESSLPDSVTLHLRFLLVLSWVRAQAISCMHTCSLPVMLMSELTFTGLHPVKCSALRSSFYVPTSFPRDTGPEKSSGGGPCTPAPVKMFPTSLDLLLKDLATPSRQGQGGYRSISSPTWLGKMPQAMDRDAASSSALGQDV